MGVERSYQAIPAGSDLLERARTEPDIGELLAMAPFYFRRGMSPETGPSSPASLELRRLIHRLVEAEPGLTTRNQYLDRRWDQIHYLLSATRRGQRAEPDDALFDVALSGETAIDERVRGAQGMLVRYTSPKGAIEVANAFQRVELATLRGHYVLEAMEQAGVYKAFAGRASEDDWQYLKGLMLGLRAFYLDVAMHGDGVLVCTD